jgi:hypothetical protein
MLGFVLGLIVLLRLELTNSIVLVLGDGNQVLLLYI